MADDPKDKSKRAEITSAELVGLRDFLGHSSTEALSAQIRDSLRRAAEVRAHQIDSHEILRNLYGWDDATRQRYRHLEEEVAGLKKNIDEQAKALQTEKLNSAEGQKQYQKLQSTYAQLQDKERLSFLLDRVNPEAQSALLRSSDFRDKFTSNSECEAFVMSVDIRRSTELMLKARKAEHFAKFITTLCGELIQSVLECYGVLDKFTGDGILCFFPEFFSGPDAGYKALLAADRCHKSFETIYHQFRTAFNSVLKDTGLGIGIDYGPTRLVQMAGGLSVVGPPVVYACRLGGAPAGKTFLNQPAYERISEGYSSYCFVHETELEIKHEGKTLAYEVNLNEQPYQPKRPNWCDEMHPAGTASDGLDSGLNR
jgi:class 3 adenylate cyclase